MSTIRIGLAGLGTVGAEVANQLINNKKELETKAACNFNLIAVSARDKKLDRGVELDKIDWVDDASKLYLRDDIDLIVELIGGSDGIALKLCEGALNNEKSVVTANKAMMSKHGYNLSKLAEENSTTIAYEASVAGCIPIIKSLREGMSGTKVNSVSGILNGTCNYILSTMRETGRSFDDVLNEAQEKGYAETDPTFDIDGIDAAQKLIILSSIAFGIVPNNKNITINGIREVDVTDIAFAEELGYRIKLLAFSKYNDRGLIQEVSPCMISKKQQMSSIEGVLNAVQIDSDLAGSVMLTGYGAGAKPTASAVLSDIISVALKSSIPIFGREAKDLLKSVSIGEADNHRYYIRVNVIDKSGVLANVTEIFRKHKLSIESLLQRGRNPNEEVPVVITTHEISETTLKAVMSELSTSKELLGKPVSMKIIS